MHLSIVCPWMGGRGATHGKLGIFRFSMSIFPPLDLHFKSNSYPSGNHRPCIVLHTKLIGT